MALGFPGQSGELCEVIGRDFFLDALVDPALRVRVLDQQPRTLDEALSIVCRMEAYSGTTSNAANADEDESHRRKVRGVNLGKHQVDVPTAPSEDNRRLQHLEETLANQQREIRQLRSEAAEIAEWRGRAEGAAATAAQLAACAPRAPPHVPPQPYQSMTSNSTSGWVNWNPLEPTMTTITTQPAQPAQSDGYRRNTGGRGRGNRVDRDSCRTCLQRGHWSRDCPTRHNQLTNTVEAPQQQANVGIISDTKTWSSETYLNIVVKGKKGLCLIDTGCERSCLPLSHVTKLKLRETDLQLYAANGTPIKVLGAIRLPFTSNGVSLSEDFLVSEDIDEIILGFHWLKRNNCQWLFDQSILVINGVNLPLIQRPSRSNFRRIYVRETIVVANDMQVNVPVRMPLSSFRAPKCDWLTQAREIKPGLYAARTLLPNEDCYAAVRFVNNSGSRQVLKRGLCLGDATPGIGPDLLDVEATLGGDAHSSRAEDMPPQETYSTQKSMAVPRLGSVGAGSPEPGFHGCSVCGGRLDRTTDDVRPSSYRPASSESACGAAYDVRPSSYGPASCGPSCSKGVHETARERSASYRPASSESACDQPACYRPSSSGQALDASRDGQSSLGPSCSRKRDLAACVRTLGREASDTAVDCYKGSDSNCDSVNDSDLQSWNRVPSDCVNDFPDSTNSTNLCSCTRISSVRAVDLADPSSLFNPTGELSYLKPVMDSLPAELDRDQRKAAADLLIRNADVFSKHEYDLGCTDLLTFNINTGDHRPVAQPLRPHPRAHLEVIDRQVDSMLQAGIIEPAASPWSANVVLVKKPGDPQNMRLTLDFRFLNQCTYKDKFPLPRINDCLDAMNGSTCFSTLDMSSSFNQVPINPHDRDKTAFITRRGQFRYKVMPMGTTNSPSTFSRLMSLVLKGLTWITCVVFIDDSIIIAKSFDEMIINLEEVLDRFRKSNLKLKPSKCKLFQSRVRFLGHIVSASGLQCDPDKVSCIANLEFPRSVSELRKFIGLTSYYRSFCPNYSQVAEPLTECLRKGASVQCTPRRLEAFNRLKKFLTTAPVLAMPTDDGDYVLDVDGSQIGAGAVLQQYQNGKLRVIEYASRTYNKHERRYCVTRLEIAALIFGLKHFRTYLLGKPFLVRCDHMAISYYRQTKEPVGQQARYLDFMAEFDFEVQFRQGSKHTNADSLSRLRPCEVANGEPCRQCNRRVTGYHDIQDSQVCRVQTRAQRRRDDGQRDSGDMLHTDSSATAFKQVVSDGVTVTGEPSMPGNVRLEHADNALVEPPGESHGKQKRARKQNSFNGIIGRTAPQAAAAGVANWTPEYIVEQQANDPDIGPAIKWLDLGARPSWEVVKPASPALRALWQQFESLVIRDGAVYRIFHNFDGSVRYYQLVLPNSMKVVFLEMVHADAAGHLKLFKCIEHVQKRAWWFTWKRDLKLYIQSCTVCSMYFRGSAPKQGQLQPMLLGGAAERFSIDLTGPHPMSDGHKYMFTAIDPFTKYAIVVPIRNKEATTVAKVIVEHIFLKWGLCFEILSDQGKEFEAELTTELLKLLGVVKLRTSGYSPATNGCIEKYHRVLNTLLAKVISENQKDWSRWVSYVTFCYNSSTHSSTGFAPHFLMTGQEPRWNIDFVLNNVDVSTQTVPEYTSTVLERLNKAFVLTREHLQQSAEVARTWYNKKVHSHMFCIGDRVRVYNPRRFKGKSPKWQSFYKDEAVVMQRLNDVTYVVKSASWKLPKVIHVNKLKRVIEFN